MWKFTGAARPSFAIEPGPDQESVWDYPRPPALQTCSQTVVVRSGELELASTQQALRLLETASPPGIYIPYRDICWSALQPLGNHSFCEWKGVASYWALQGSPDGQAVAWAYPESTERYGALREHLSFYPGRVQCFIDGESVRPQASEFYGGWITDQIVGPFKGEAGREGW